MNIIELEKKFAELNKEIERLKEKEIERLKEKNEDKLHIEVNFLNSLCLVYKDKLFGFIKENGRCCILSTEIMVEEYEQWRADGMPIDTETVVEWRGGKYRLTEDYELQRIDIDIGIIYDFYDCVAFAKCEDTNIIRFKHNNRPIIF